MKKFLSAVLAGLMISSLAVSSAYAEPLGGFDPGIENLQGYQEVVFLTGRPVLMKGTVKTSIKEKDDERTEKYTYKLEDSSGEFTLSRSLSLTATLQDNYGQTVEVAEVDSFKETIKLGDVTYSADDKTSEFTQSIIYDNKPAVSYYAGNMAYRKVYKGDDETPTITVDMEGSSVGYDQAWGNTETRTMNYYISSSDPKGIQGSYTVKNSNNITKDIVYAENQPTQISFRGGYMVSEKDESVMEYSYDINGRVGSNSLTLANNPKFTRLNVPELRDTSGHWAEEPIKILASLNAISPNAKNFAPSLAISREEFAKAVAVVSDIVEEETTVRRSKKTQEQPLFTDTALDSEKYKYVKAVATKGIMGGVGEDRFEPKGELSKAQAATILINALGVEALAPNGAYSTGFKDDYSIPYWAKDSVYMARSLGLIDGTENGFFQPNKSLTRAEAASILNNYIHYLSYDLREDFRERIVNY